MNFARSTHATWSSRSISRLRTRSSYWSVFRCCEVGDACDGCFDPQLARDGDRSRAILMSFSGVSGVRSGGTTPCGSFEVWRMWRAHHITCSGWIFSLESTGMQCTLVFLWLRRVNLYYKDVTGSVYEFPVAGVLSSVVPTIGVETRTMLQGSEVEVQRLLEEDLREREASEYAWVVRLVA